MSIKLGTGKIEAYDKDGNIVFAAPVGATSLSVAVDIKSYCPMTYNELQVRAKLLAHGTYKGLDFYVVSRGTHPCAYINAAETDLVGKDTDELDDTGIDCHGGFTFANNALSVSDGEGWYIGWDYAHAGDFTGWHWYRLMGNEDCQMWTTVEIIAECIGVIDQIILWQENKNK